MTTPHTTAQGSHRPRKRMTLAAMMTASSLALMGCSALGIGGDRNDAGSQQTESEAQSTETNGPNPSLGPGASSRDGNSAECGDLTGDQAVDRWLDRVPGGFPWQASDTSTYDPCQPLSWIQLTQSGASSRSAEQLMLFHMGEYLGTATSDPLNGMSTVGRVNDSTIRVNQPREDRADEFRWDDGAQRVLMNDGSDDSGATSGGSGAPATANNPSQVGGNCGQYDGATVTAGDSTSCGFAMAVAQEALQPIYSDIGMGYKATVSATSPETGDTYSMECTIGSDASLSTCRGGNNAKVEIEKRGLTSLVR
ncbi:LppP/LprE family lipoprotein [Corynebacterium sputi]|uniref:LppP/LprE family lipoprotein n=1 Tax=Corynebacterium sputi TaxID=489915 RepID=UPI000684B634|nr:LppP/LprE family lipoprotein [Corynebacterium sputi]